MHKFLKAIGFSNLTIKELDDVLDDVVERANARESTLLEDGTKFEEMTLEVAKNIGIKVYGVYKNGEYEVEYFTPYLEGTIVSTTETIEIERRFDKVAYAGVCDEVRIGVTLIFHVQNPLDFLKKNNNKLDSKNVIAHGAILAGLADTGKILLPLNKEINKRNRLKNPSNKDRNILIAKAREGNEEAIEDLAASDMDMYAMLSKRVKNEDILSIVSTYVMPYGIESDCYSVLGNIVDYYVTKNTYTDEIIYVLKLEANEMYFDVCINKKDLLGEPMNGRRFKGNIWLQGELCI